MAPRCQPTLARSAFVLIAACTVAASATPAGAQAEESPFSVWANRVYEAYEPWEMIDTSTGQVNLVFTDLVLPGNGWDLRFERRLHVTTGVSGIGIAGLPLRTWPLYDEFDAIYGHVFATTSGGVQLDVQVGAGTGSSIWMNDRLWRYHEDSNTLSLPDGRQAIYAGGRLSQVRDAGGRLILTVDWQAAHVTVTQHLGNGQQRDVVFAGSLMQQFGQSNHLPATMTYQGRTWYYAKTDTDIHVTLPEGLQWAFTWTKHDPPYNWPVKWLGVTTPHGGQVEYTFAIEPYPPTSFSNVLRYRRIYSEQSQLIGQWTYEYVFSSSDPFFIEQTTVLGPDTAPNPRATTTYTYTRLTGVSHAARRIVLTGRTVAAESTLLEQESVSYTVLPFPYSIDGLPVVEERTLTRGGVTHTTTYGYRSTDYGDFHRPWTIVATTGGASRTTSYQYDHSFGLSLELPYVVGLPKAQEVTIAGET